MSSATGVSGARLVVERHLREVLGGDGPAGVEDLVSNPIYSHQIRAFRSAFPDLSVESQQVVAERDLVAVHGVASATHRGMFQGLPSTGRQWRAPFTAMYRVSDGRITDFWVTWDLLSIMEQLGGVRRSAEASA